MGAAIHQVSKMKDKSIITIVGMTGATVFCTAMLLMGQHELAMVAFMGTVGGVLGLSKIYKEE